MNAQSSNRTAGDAVLFIPGIGERDSSDEAALAFATRLAGALDHGAATARAVFRVQSRVEDTRKELGERRLFVCSITRIDPDGSERPAIDVYKLDYRDVLVEDYEQRSSVGRTLITGLEALKGLGRIGRALLRGGGIGRRRLMHVLLALILWLLIVVYFTVLFVSLASLALHGWDQLQSPHAETTLGAIFPALSARLPAWASDLLSSERLRTFIVLGGTVVGAVMPARAKTELVGMGANYVRMCTYLSVGHQRDALLGRFHALLEHVAERENGYARVHVIAHSFGSVVALDALFPPASHGSVNRPRLASIQKLVTVGCPFDFVRALWPRYFRGRAAASPAPASWLNVYTPPDALGSNFRDDDAEKEPTVSLGGRTPVNLVYQRAELGWIDTLTFLALRSHAIYWSPEGDAHDLGCLREAVTVAFADEPVLS